MRRYGVRSREPDRLATGEARATTCGATGRAAGSLTGWQPVRRERRCAALRRAQRGSPTGWQLARLESDDDVRRCSVHSREPDRLVTGEARAALRRTQGCPTGWLPV